MFVYYSFCSVSTQNKYRRVFIAFFCLLLFNILELCEKAACKKQILRILVTKGLAFQRSFRFNPMIKEERKRMMEMSKVLFLLFIYFLY